MSEGGPKLSPGIAAPYRDGAFDIAEVMDTEATRLFTEADELPAICFIRKRRYWHTASTLQRMAAKSRISVNSVLPYGTPPYEK